jgi:flagellin-like protein
VRGNQKLKQISFRKEKAISPIIATLLLILIAIAAGVVVYAYVIGFVGSTTGGSNSRGVLSIDLASATAASGKVTVFVRNTGSLAESFNNGFYIAGQSLASTQLNLAAFITTSSSFTGTATITIVRATANTLTVSESGMTAGTITVTFLGNSLPSPLTTTTTSGTITIPSSNPAGVTIASGTTFAVANTISTASLTNSVDMVTMTGTLTLPVGGLQELDFTQTGLSSSMSAGSSYTVTVIAQDGTSITASVKSS